MRVWDDLITSRDRLVFEKAGYGKQINLGRKPAILVIDVSTAFIGDKSEPILTSIERFPNSCGEEGWKGIKNIQELLAVSRPRNIPIIYTASLREGGSRLGLWGQKHPRTLEIADTDLVTSKSIPDEIAPQPGDIVIEKT